MDQSVDFRLRFRVALEDRLPVRLRQWWRSTFGLLDLIAREFSRGAVADLTWRKRVGLWKRGFLSESFLLYNRDGHIHWEDYVSDFQRFVRAPRINGPSSTVLDDKLLFYLSLSGLTDRLVPVWAVSGRSGWMFLKGTSLQQLLASAEGSGLIIKPRFRDGGYGIIRLDVRNAGLYAGEKQVSFEEMVAMGRDLDRICSPFALQDGYAYRVFPGSTNTIRILTLGDASGRGSYLAAAVHRFAEYKAF